MVFDTGTRRSVKLSSAVSEDRMPSLSSLRETVQRRGRHGGLDPDRQRDPAGVDPAEFFMQDDAVEVVGALPAVGRVVLKPEQTQVAQLGEQLMGRESPGRLPLVGEGLDLLL